MGVREKLRWPPNYKLTLHKNRKAWEIPIYIKFLLSLKFNRLSNEQLNSLDSNDSVFPC